MVHSTPFDPQNSTTTPSPGDASAGGGQFSVEVAYLLSLIRPLRESMAAGRQVSKHPEQLTEHLGDTGSDTFAEAAGHFVSSWGYGMGKLVTDADLIADKLQETVDSYTGTDDQVAASMNGTAAGGGNTGPGPVTAWAEEHIIKPTGMDSFSDRVEDTWKSVFG
ncbi:hypothetical protein ACFXPN_36640 [Streptomyces griseorubiginosus]|uniref:hypothetical protein n=1 Tax=Streptomyces griseorubiginosus TaxID=67304 RepID=UPI00369067E8